MKSSESRVQLLMAVVGSFLVLAVFTPQLFAEDPVPPGATYEMFNTNLTWAEDTGNPVGQPGKTCIQQGNCILAGFCFTPYNANFGGTQYQSMKVSNNIVYGLCAEPLPGTNPGPDCPQRPTVKCAIADVYIALNCPFGGDSAVKDIYRKDACRTN